MHSCLSNHLVDAAWSRGILLVGGARTLESLDKITACVMDKTGTLTEGVLHVDSCQFENGVDSNLCYLLLFHAEKAIAQSHPAGKAIFQFALQQLHLRDGEKKIVFLEVEEYRYVPGQGVSCKVYMADTRHHSIFVGSRSFLTQKNVALGSHWLSEGSSDLNEVLFSIDGKLAGLLFLQVWPRFLHHLSRTAANIKMKGQNTRRGTAGHWRVEGNES